MSTSANGFVEWACPHRGCAAIVVLHQATDAKYRKTGETFYCPNGHDLSFNGGRTADQKRIEELERDLRRTRESRDNYKERLDIAVRTCPWVGCAFVAAEAPTWDRRALHTHMRARHGMPTLAVVQAQEAQAS